MRFLRDFDRREVFVQPAGLVARPVTSAWVCNPKCQSASPADSRDMAAAAAGLSAQVSASAAPRHHHCNMVLVLLLQRGIVRQKSATHSFRELHRKGWGCTTNRR